MILLTNFLIYRVRPRQKCLHSNSICKYYNFLMSIEKPLVDAPQSRESRSTASPKRTGWAPTCARCRRSAAGWSATPAMRRNSRTGRPPTPAKSAPRCCMMLALTALSTQAESRGAADTSRRGASARNCPYRGRRLARQRRNGKCALSSAFVESIELQRFKFWPPFLIFRLQSFFNRTPLIQVIINFCSITSR